MHTVVRVWVQRDIDVAPRDAPEPAVGVGPDLRANVARPMVAGAFPRWLEEWKARVPELIGS
jgi:hypothetical protein